MLPPRARTKLWSVAKIESYQLFNEPAISFDWDSYLVGPVPALAEPWDCVALHQDPWDIYNPEVRKLDGPWRNGKFPVNTAVCGFRDLALRDQYCDAVFSCAEWFEQHHPSTEGTQVVVFSEQYVFDAVTQTSRRKILCDRPFVGYSNSIPLFHLWGNKSGLVEEGPRKRQAYETALRLKKWFAGDVTAHPWLNELVESALSGELSDFDSATGKRSVISPADLDGLPKIIIPERPQWEPWSIPPARKENCQGCS